MNPTYRLEMLTPEGTEVILESEKDLLRVRRVATSRKLGKRLNRMGRRLIVLRDGKEVRGGRYALDELCYQHWLEVNEGRTFLHWWQELTPELFR